MTVPPEQEAPLNEVPEQPLTEEDLNCLRLPCAETNGFEEEEDEEEE